MHFVQLAGASCNDFDGFTEQQNGASVCGVLKAYVPRAADGGINA